MPIKKTSFWTQLQSGGIGGGTIYVIAILGLLVSLGAVLTNGVIPSDKIPTGAAVTIVPPAIDSGKKNLQLFTFGYTTPAPTTPPVPTTPPDTGICQPDTGGSQRTCECIPGEQDFVYCKEDPCQGNHDLIADTLVGRLNFPPFNVPIDYTCSYTVDSPLHNQKKLQTNCIHVCFGKPVIYLYPTITTLVDVKLTIPGTIYISDPLYQNEGWKNVLAHPDGSLVYKGKNYHELYYESQVGNVADPDNGVVIPAPNLKEKLIEITHGLGLVQHEQAEFLEYWMPKLEELKSPYILFSIMDPKEKDRVDHVDITPEPDTRIEFLAYFKPQKSSITKLKPLPLPASPPKRIGFTTVEWGGTIAQ